MAKNDPNSGQTDKTAADATAQPGKSGADAGKTIDELLASWDQDADDSTDDGKTKGQGAQASAQSPADVKALMERLSRLEQERAESTYRSDIARVVQSVKGDLDVDDFLVESWVNQRASEDQRLVKLWENRDSRKREFNSVMKALGDEFGEWARQRGLVKESRQAGQRLAAAVAGSRDRNTSSRGDYDGVDFGSLNDSEFALKKAEIFRRAAAGQL